MTWTNTECPSNTLEPRTIVQSNWLVEATVRSMVIYLYIYMCIIEVCLYELLDLVNMVIIIIIHV